MNTRHLLMVATLCLGQSAPLTAEEKKIDKAPLDLTALKIDQSEIALPTPGEILTTLKSAKAETWKAALAALGAPAGNTSDEASSAVLLGAAVADCFLAIETKDATLFDDRAKSVLAAARKLGAEEPLLESGASLSKMAKDGKWSDMPQMLDRLHLASIDAMRKIGDEDAEAICLASGWLRGLALYTEALGAEYTAEGTLALRQKDLVKHLAARLGTLSESAAENESVKSLIAAFDKLPAALPDGKEDTLTKEQVATLNTIAKGAAK